MKEKERETAMDDKKGNGDGADDEKKQKKKRKGLVSWIFGFFRMSRSDDFEKRLQYISKEEAAVLSRMKRRSHSWRRMARHLILFSLLFEIVAVGYAVVTTRSVDLDWKMRAFRVLPMFLLPALSFASYSALVSFTKMCDRKDQKTVERLRTERQAKIDELKEKTNYYSTQQLIQRYDPDPAAKAAAATVLASKLGADSGLKVFVGDESQSVASTGKSNDVELAQSSGLRNRKELHTRASSEGSTMTRQSDGGTPTSAAEHEQLVVDHYYPDASSIQNNGWIARLAALLVGEDPMQSYALICGNCHMHNGLARKEDFPFITYYCPHCRALNQPKQSEEHVSGSTSPDMGSLRMGSGGDTIDNTAGSASDSVATTTATLGAAEVVEAPEKVASGDSAPKG
ncbi:uncharacterized protein At2g24330-like [Syzygium oleosum]|uniref:uncharacterized protein At2g24330-like n=1 Tax=Syzygium oleosum TaxID=219896 RepID=UPI0011D24250|nr:uncharacterized protein At2g24330-like [Syzygium oleosum]XP_056163098.1 uncharacterized protein At2g24330-like [Syzygium oleosum]XP_056163099.1 uncharacterized protein At2g24330-like [Syzygium oleosum]XP_056164005.1 uncharacterized protein At2g24330-like [Syzygium oleosum]